MKRPWARAQLGVVTHRYDEYPGAYPGAILDDLEAHEPDAVRATSCRARPATLESLDGEHSSPHFA